MGNKGKGGQLRRKNQPHKLLLSGDTTVVAIGGASGGDTASDKPTLDIQLVKIDLGVAAQVAVGNPLKLRLNGLSYEACFENQRLGQVPIQYNESLLPQSEYSGRLVKVAIYGDPIVIVRIRLTIQEK